MHAPLLSTAALALLVAPFPRMPRAPAAQALPPVTTSIALTVRSGSVETRTLVRPPSKDARDARDAREPPPRPTAAVRSGEKPQVRWLVRNMDPKRPVSQVAVHFLIHRERSAGQPIPEEPRQGSVADQVLGTDLPPGGTTSGNYNVAIYEPGSYLVELELLTPEGVRRQYATIELKVE